MSHVSEIREHKRPVPTGRLARTLHWLRWPLLAAWVVAAVLLYPLAHNLANVANNTAAANLPSSASSTRVLLIEQAAERGQAETDAAIVVLAREHGLTAADIAAATSARTAVARLVGHVDGLDAPGPEQRSADGEAVEFSAGITAPTASAQSADVTAVQAIRQAVAGPASRIRDGLQVAVAGPAAVNADTNVSSGAVNALLITAIGIIAIILLIAYRSPLLWLPPLIGAILALDVGKAAAHGLANAGLTVSGLSVDILTVLVLGAASDYALLLVHRYREELRGHAAKEDAMVAALRRTLPTLLASAGTVVCAMLCLLAAQSAALHGLGPVGAVGIAAALLVQVTFLPALLLIGGRPLFWPRVPRAGQAGREESRVWSAVGARVSHHTLPVMVAAVFVLGAACAGLAALHIDNNPVASVKGHPGSVTGTQLLLEHFPAQDASPLDLLAPPGEAGAAAAAARATTGVSAVTAGPRVGTYDYYSVSLSAPAYSAGAYATVASLRDHLGRGAPGALVGGNQAIQYDIIQAARHDALVLIPLVLVVIFIVVALLLQAVVAPLLLIITTAISFAASFGLSSLLWRGLGFSGIEAQIPLYVFIFLVALGVDYNIFLTARIREESRHAGIRPGTLRGLAVTGGVITAAGLVMAGTFGDLARIPYVPVTEVGIAVAVGVLLDTLLVRTVLVPASLLAIGERVWWPARSA